MTLPAAFKKIDVKRFVAGVLAAGLPIARVEVTPDGKISVIRESSAANDEDSDYGEWDDIGAEKQTQTP